MSEDLEQRVAAVGAKGHRTIVAGTIRGDEHRVSGWAAAGAAPDGSTLFEIGSITKALTGVLLADLHLRGEVSLDDPLSRHLPSPAPAWRHREPTLLELATHRSGLPNTPKPLGRRELAYVAGVRRRDPWADVGPDHYARLVRRESPRAAPGRRFRYSSMGVALLGEALAARAGTAYEALLTERVLAPLAMASTTIAVPEELRPRLLGGHARRGRPRPPLEDHLAPAGSVRSSADDMLRFLAACLSPPAEPPGPALALAQQPHAAIGRRRHVGLCWMLLDRPGGDRIVWHNGGTWGFRSFAGFAPARGTAGVALTNTSRGVDALGMELAAGPPR